MPLEEGKGHGDAETGRPDPPSSPSVGGEWTEASLSLGASTLMVEAGSLAGGPARREGRSLLRDSPGPWLTFLRPRESVAPWLEGRCLVLGDLPTPTFLQVGSAQDSGTQSLCR